MGSRLRLRAGAAAALACVVVSQSPSPSPGPVSPLGTTCGATLAGSTFDLSVMTITNGGTYQTGDSHDSTTTFYWNYCGAFVCGCATHTMLRLRAAWGPRVSAQSPGAASSPSAARRSAAGGWGGGGASPRSRAPTAPSSVRVVHVVARSPPLLCARCLHPPPAPPQPTRPRRRRRRAPRRRATGPRACPGRSRGRTRRARARATWRAAPRPRAGTTP